MVLPTVGWSSRLPQSDLRRLAPLRCARGCSHRQPTTTETFNSELACLSPFRAKYCWLSVVHLSAFVLRIVTSFLLWSLCVFIRHSSTSAQLKNDLTGSVRGRRKEDKCADRKLGAAGLGRLLETSAPWKLMVFTFQLNRKAGVLHIARHGGRAIVCGEAGRLRLWYTAGSALPNAGRKESSGSHHPGRRSRGGCVLHPLSTLVLSFHLGTQSTLVSGRLCHSSPVRSLFDMASSCKHTHGLRTFHSWSPAVWLTVCLLLKLLTELVFGLCLCHSPSFPLLTLNHCLFTGKYIS